VLYLHRYYCGEQTKADEIGRAFFTHSGEYVYTGFCWGKPEEKKKGKRGIILRWILKE